MRFRPWQGSGRNDGEWKNDSSLTMLDAQGRPIDENDLSSKAKELLADYRSVQYDMCVGKKLLGNHGLHGTAEIVAHTRHHTPSATAHDNCDSIIERLNEHEERCTARWATYTRATDPLRKTQARQDPRGIS